MPGPAVRPMYQVLSLDLHDTTVWDTPPIVAAQYEVRFERLAHGLRGPGGRRVTAEEVREARNRLRGELTGRRRFIESLPIPEQVERIRASLGAEFGEPVADVLRGFDEGGLREHPPTMNPEAIKLVRELNSARVPVIVITDTSRSGATWKAFLEEGGRLRLAAVVASTDVGACKPDPRIFVEAARQAGSPASQILHVGDSWRWDVEGAVAAGMGAALYRGLWSRYWDPEHPREGPPAERGSVPCVDRLEDVRHLLGPR